MATKTIAPVNDGAQVLDPAIAARQAFDLAHDALETSSENSASKACNVASRAYRAMMAEKATTARGVLAQLQGHLRWAGGAEDEDHKAIAAAVANLETLLDAAKRPDLCDIASELEGTIGKVESMAAMVGRMADNAKDGQDALVLFHFLHSMQSIHAEQRAVFKDLWDVVTGRAVA